MSAAAATAWKDANPIFSMMSMVSRHSHNRPSFAVYPQTLNELIVSNAVLHPDASMMISYCVRVIDRVEEQFDLVRTYYFYNVLEAIRFRRVMRRVVRVLKSRVLAKNKTKFFL
jgi:hypothetical protein